MFHDQQPARPSAANSGTWGVNAIVHVWSRIFWNLQRIMVAAVVLVALLSPHMAESQGLCAGDLVDNPSWDCSNLTGLCSTITVGSTQWLVLFPWSCSSMMLAVTFAIEVEFSLDSTELYNQSWNIRFRHDQTAVVDISAKLNYYCQ